LGEVRLRIQRFDPSTDGGPEFRNYIVPTTDTTSVLDALLYTKSYLDHSLAVRFSCRMSSCGSCGMKVNGRPVLACETQLSALGWDYLTIQPMDNFPIIRDLVVDLEGFFAHHRDVMPHLERKDVREQEQPTGEYLMKPQDLDALSQFTYCIKCGLCTSSCPTVGSDSRFLGPQALTQAYRYAADVRDEAGSERLELVDIPHGVWHCHFSRSCSEVCPKGVDPSLGIQLLKRHVLSAKQPRTDR
jgi:succinate dehydrogenase / fumarate reductase, iron-sulfur subunit